MSAATFAGTGGRANQCDFEPTVAPGHFAPPRLVFQFNPSLGVHTRLLTAPSSHSARLIHQLSPFLEKIKYKMDQPFKDF
jgi:hypothetical protein